MALPLWELSPSWYTSSLAPSTTRIFPKRTARGWQSSHSCRNRGSWGKVCRQDRQHVPEANHRLAILLRLRSTELGWGLLQCLTHTLSPQEPHSQRGTVIKELRKEIRNCWRWSVTRCQLPRRLQKEASQLVTAKASLHLVKTSAATEPWGRDEEFKGKFHVRVTWSWRVRWDSLERFLVLEYYTSLL
jgi:hypothetical protein